MIRIVFNKGSYTSLFGTPTSLETENKLQDKLSYLLWISLLYAAAMYKRDFTVTALTKKIKLL